MCLCDPSSRTPFCGKKGCVNPSQFTAGWFRSSFMSFWGGPDLEIIVVQDGRSSEDWKWTCRGWREPDDIDKSDEQGWVRALDRESAEEAAMWWYMEKDD